MRDLDDSDLKELKKAELIKLFLELQEERNTLKRSNIGYRAGNTRLTKELAGARKEWAEWRYKYGELREQIYPESIRTL